MLGLLHIVYYQVTSLSILTHVTSPTFNIAEVVRIIVTAFFANKFGYFYLGYCNKIVGTVLEVGNKMNATFL